MSSAITSHSIQSLYQHHHSWLRQWFLQRLRCDQQSADLAHDTFLRLLRKPANVETLQQPRAYLTTVAKGILVSWYRRRDVEQAWLDTLAAQPEATVPSPEQRELVLEALCLISDALEQLPETERQAFLLAQCEGLKYRQIAEQLKVSEISVKRYVKRGLVACLTVMGEV